ncbi:hypothetical protein ACQSMD_31345 [Streptomyces flavovirens]|uniref:hypothetical protein n=1 Tax=Streptomyces flavovirens TaxID=52258 RepID=UPI003D125ECC
MISIEDIFSQQDGYLSSAPVDCDPFKDPDALFDVQLLDCRVCPTSNSAALLLEMRTAEYFSEGNAAILIVRGLREFHWDGATVNRLMAFSVQEYSFSEQASGGAKIKLGFFPSGDLVLEGVQADFYLLEVSGIPKAPPNYTERKLGEIRKELPWWDSDCTVLQSCTTSSA